MAEFTKRAGFDHVARLPIRVGERSMTRSFNYLYIDRPSEQRDDYFNFVVFQLGPIADWLRDDERPGRYTIKLFLDQVLVSFDDPHTAFAFKTRWG